MTYLSAIFLGFVQGITEFLPISSSGHLSVLQNLFKINTSSDGHMFFDVLLHLGTLVSVCFVYRRDIVDMIREFFMMIGEFRSGKETSPKASIASRRMILLLIVGTLPLFIAVPLNSYVEQLYYNTFFIGAVFLLTGCMLYVSDKLQSGRKTSKNMTVKDALIVGVCQCVAIVPGLSRSGTTITAGVATGLYREYSVKFAFLLSIPAIVGANILSLFSVSASDFDASLVPVYLVGMITAAATGILAIGLVKYITTHGKFGNFAYYCWTIGFATIILALIF